MFAPRTPEWILQIKAESWQKFPVTFKIPNTTLTAVFWRMTFWYPYVTKQILTLLRNLFFVRKQSWGRTKKIKMTTCVVAPLCQKVRCQESWGQLYGAHHKTNFSLITISLKRVRMEFFFLPSYKTVSHLHAGSISFSEKTSTLLVLV